MTYKPQLHKEFSREIDCYNWYEEVAHHMRRWISFSILTCAVRKLEYKVEQATECSNNRFTCSGHESAKSCK